MNEYSLKVIECLSCTNVFAVLGEEGGDTCPRCGYSPSAPFNRRTHSQGLRAASLMGVSIREMSLEKSSEHSRCLHLISQKLIEHLPDGIHDIRMWCRKPTVGYAQCGGKVYSSKSPAETMSTLKGCKLVLEHIKLFEKNLFYAL